VERHIGTRCAENHIIAHDLFTKLCRYLPETPTPSSPEEHAADLDPDLDDFCNRFDLDPAVENVSEEDDKRDQEDLSDEPEICTQTELDLFSSALREAQQVAIEAEQCARKQKTPKTYTGGSKKTEGKNECQWILRSI
jgi:hypothetical protein